MIYARQVYRALRKHLQRDMKAKELPWDTIDLLDSLNAGQNSVCIDALCLTGSTSISAPSASPTEGDTAAYGAVPTDFIRAYNADYKDSSDNVSPMGILPVEQLDLDKTGWRNFEPTTAAPKYVFMEQGLIGTYPEMDTDNEGTVYVHYYKLSRALRFETGYAVASGENMLDSTKTLDWSSVVDPYKNGLFWTKESAGENKRLVSSSAAGTIVSLTTGLLGATVALPSTCKYLIESASELNDAYERPLLEYAKYDLTGDDRYLQKYEMYLGKANVKTKRSMIMRPPR